MRQLSEINKDIKEIDGRIKALYAQREILNDERIGRLFADFCYTYGVKKGDVVHTNRYGDMMICGIDVRYKDWIRVRKIKKNGEPNKVYSAQLPITFEGCKVIGHIDDEEIW